MLKFGEHFCPWDEDLDNLSQFMTGNVAPVNSEIPAGYTYLAQFIDHDIALDSMRKAMPFGRLNPATLVNLRNPVFDLETVYGFDNPFNPNEPKRNELLKPGSNSILNLDETVKDLVVQRTFENDLPRKTGSRLARIVDERNDENLAIAQTQVAFMKFHNAVAAHLGGQDTTAKFDEVRQIVIHHYQWIILKDFLPKIIKGCVLKRVLDEGNKFYNPQPNDVFMPLEFSVAAFRMGHSMVRDAYQWNRIFNSDVNALPETLAELRQLTGEGGMRGKNNLPSDWVINWNWFYDIDDSKKLQKEKFNFSPLIDTKIAPSLGFLKSSEITFKREFSLSALDLYRTRALGLPTGQAVAEKMLETADDGLEADDIAGLLPENLKDVFAGQTPLWFYLLAEAEINEKGQTLGEVGSRIVAETFIALLRLDKSSILNNKFQPDPDLLGDSTKFGMAEMLKFIRSKNNDFDELNPTKES